MHTKRKRNAGDSSTQAHLLHGMIATLSLSALVFLSLAATEDRMLAVTSPSPHVIASTKVVTTLPVMKGSPRSTPIVDRVMDRLHGSAEDIPMTSILAALEKRALLMERSVFIGLHDPDGVTIATGSLALRDHPTWLSLDTSGGRARTAVDAHQVRLSIVRFASPFVTAPSHCMLHSFIESEEGKPGYRKGVTDGCIVKDGQTFDVEKAVHDVLASIESQAPVTVTLRHARGMLYNTSGEDLGELTLLGSGKSNFKGSTWGRVQNVKKAINEHLNNLVIPAGTDFSFNATLGGPVSQSRGWHMALGIFEGGELRPTPGGGICQTSTTMFRAALNTGLPILEQASHSLFVTYYEQYGVGQDATIFPGFRDFRFRNDTGHALFTQAYVDGEDVIINIYGTPDGRMVETAGPYFRENGKGTVQRNGRDLYGNEIAWLRRVTSADGTVTEEPFVSRYKSVPQYIRKRWVSDDVAYHRVNEATEEDI